MPDSERTCCDIALFAPSGRPDMRRLERGLAISAKECPELLESIAAVEISGEEGPFPWLFDSDESQAENFTLLMQGEYSFLWAMRGGYGSLRWLGLVDWKEISGKRRPVVTGFSDVTAIQAALIRTGQVSLHAPMVCTLETTSSGARSALWECFTKGILPVLHGNCVVAGSGRVRARLSGGNLCTLCHLFGTAFEPDFTGTILFLEDINEPLYRIDRMLTHLIEAGRLSGVKAVVAGEFSGTETDASLLHALLSDRLGGLGVPVVSGFPIGHGRDNMPLLIGGEYELDCETLSLTPLGTISMPFR